MKIGMIFPGQGSQFVGMAKEFYDNERLVQEYFEQASSCLNQNFIKLCFASSEKELMETVNTQTSVFLVSAAIYALLKEKYSIRPTLFAGHSLGEYSAVFAAGGINFADGLYLLKKRAMFMEEATREHPGGMLAVLNCSENRLRPIVERYNVPGSDNAVAEIVNFNSPRQFVVSGTLSLLGQIAEEVVKVRGRAILLKVSGAFHSRLMKHAQQKFANYMEKVDFHNLTSPFISNVRAQIVTSAKDIRESLVDQLSAPVLWWQSMQYFRQCDIIVEVGPGTKLTNLLAKEWKDKILLSINDQRDIDHLVTILKNANYF